MDNNPQVRPRREWVEEADCRDLSLEDSDRIFHLNKPVGRPSKNQPYEDYCGSCPVQRECMAFAIVHDYYGVWGGTTRGQRRKIPAPIRKSLLDQAKSEGWFEPVLPVLTEGVPTPEEDYSPTPRYFQSNPGELAVEIGATTLEFDYSPVLDFRLTAVVPTPQTQALREIEFPEVLADFSIVSGL